MLLSGTQKWLLYFQALKNGSCIFDLPSIHEGQDIRAYGGHTEKGSLCVTVKSGTEVNDPLSPFFLGAPFLVTLFLGTLFLGTPLRGGVNAACQ